ncbi:MAG: membrane protein insertase YidC [Propionibacteriaceae bacterium]|jgi:YidC/Oxa1 family membrane protein insertase|nr:membrane protein insertase YidC [Propionibacteriaceae bacterium]
MILLGIGDWFSALLQPIRVAISYVLMWAYKFWSMITGEGANGVTWTLAIISLVVLVRILLIPLFIRQINSTRRMQLVQPKLKALQDKYGSDRERLGIETQKLMRQEGVNPASSCLPLLLQMPIFFALYQVLQGAAVGIARAKVFEPYVGWVQDSTLFGAKLAGKLFPFTPWGMTQTLALILVIIMTALFFITQKQLMSKNMTPEALTGPMAQQQKMMLYIFPVVYLFMGFVIQIGVLIYWVTSNLWTLGQQWVLIRNNPSPGTPAYIDWEERMIRHGKDPRQLEQARQAKLSRGPKEAKTQTGTSGVQRQAVKPPAGQAGDSSSSESGVQRQAVTRNQPKKQSRAQRKGPSGSAKK